MTVLSSKSDATYLESEEGYLDRDLSELAHDPEFVANGLALALAEDVAGALVDAKISKAELARRMGVSRSYVTRVLDAPPNLTLMSISKVALALGLTPEIRLRRPCGFSSLEESLTAVETPSVTLG